MRMGLEGIKGGVEGQAANLRTSLARKPALTICTNQANNFLPSFGAWRHRQLLIFMVHPRGQPKTKFIFNYPLESSVFAP